MKKQSHILPHERMAHLQAQQNRKMAESAHAYVRGSTIRFYEWLSASSRPALPDGPPTWICGDCHIGNLGPVASANGQLAIQIRDLDQTVIGNPAHDLVRLGLSLAMAARGSDLPGITTAHMLEHVMDGYERAIRPCEAETVTEVALPRLVRLALREAAGRSWKHLADERIEGVAPRIPLGRRFWPLTQEETDAVTQLFEKEDPRRLVTSLRSRDSGAPIRVMDAAYWRKGCSSLGRLRMAVLVAIDEGKAERHCLMDIKEAIEAAAPHADQAEMPADPGDRVVTGARNLSPYLGARMMASTLLGKSVFVRELLPQDLKLEIEHVSAAEATEIARFLAYVVGSAHARQLETSARIAWHSELQRDRSGTLDAPSWLWDSVVDLIGAHEIAYLRHCRRYAFQAAA